MIRNYRDLTRWEMEQVDRENTIVLIPLGALEQHGNQAPLGTDDIIAEAMSQEIKKALEAEGEEDPSLIMFTVILWSIKPNTSRSTRSRPPSILMMSFLPILLLRAFLMMATQQSSLSSPRLL